jgi:hypothetical protein
MLKGSPKQVTWAKRIRAERLSTWKKSDAEVFQEVESKLNNELSASWWITYREKSLSEVIPYIVESGERKDIVKPKDAKVSSTVAPKETLFSGLDAVHRFVGKLKDSATGEHVVDSECPF